jgi:hypothetical protein
VVLSWLNGSITVEH